MQPQPIRAGVFIFTQTLKISHLLDQPLLLVELGLGCELTDKGGLFIMSRRFVVKFAEVTHGIEKVKVAIFVVIGELLESVEVNPKCIETIFQ